MGQRGLRRTDDAALQYPLRCVFKWGADVFENEVINFHFLGACLKVPQPELQELLLEGRILQVELRLGTQLLKEDVEFRLCWNSFDEDQTAGIEFLRSVSPFVERQARFPTHAKLRPSLSCKDPLDPNRELFFSVHNVSSRGMLLATSLSNKHLFPGMHLRRAHVSVQGGTSVEVSLLIENTRPSPAQDEFYVGVSLTGSDLNMVEVFSRYLASLSLSDADPELVSTQHLGRQLKGALSFRRLATPADYDELLKLRFAGYSKHGKVRPGSTPSSMGDGLENEGQLLAAYLGSKMVAAVELRFGDEPRGLRYLEPSNPVFSQLNPLETVEINKLVVHPNLQGSDVVLGMIQKCHAIVMARGSKWDAVFCATDKLVPLYKRAGAEELGYSIEHPNVLNTRLNFMVIRRDLYLGRDHFNPYAWSVVYSSVVKSMTEWGMARPPKATALRSLGFMAGWLWSRIPRLRKGASDSRRAIKSQGGRFVDPKWTRQDMLASVIEPYLLEVEDLHGAQFLTQILDKLGVPRSYFRSKSNWVSVELLNSFLSEYQLAGGDLLRINERAGWRSLARDVLGINYHIIKHLLTPLHAFRTSFEKFMPRINRSRTYKLLSASPQRIRVAVGVRSDRDLPLHPETCANWRASFEAYIQLLTGSRGRIQKIACRYKGDTECVYEIKWDEGRKKGIELALQSSVWAVGLSLAALVHAATASYYKAGLVALLAWTQWSRYRQTRRGERLGQEIQSLREESIEFQSESNERYADLQAAKHKLDARYRESVLLEECSRKIQSSHSVDDILKVTMEQARSLLGLSRAFVMLADGKREFLTTQGILGIEEAVGDVWSYKVDVRRKRDNPTVISSVFLTGEPVIIEDMQKQLFQLNAESRALAMKLNSTGFIMVQIPGHEKPWGVILADRLGSGEQRLGKSELTLLSRVAQLLGLALDKQYQIETERNLKKKFQSYVPWAANVDAELELKLGGELKKVSCLFLDIRSFTSLSSQLPPQAVIAMLNLFFGEVASVVRKHDGVIDKFLGDGALMSWGALPGSKADPNAVVSCAVELLSRKSALGAKLKQSGFSELDFGMGVSVGEAVAGNLGSLERMEHTVIGPTVNLASRLETLSKSLGSPLVISQECFDELAPELRLQFELIDGVEVRGLARAIRVARWKQLVELKNAA